MDKELFSNRNLIGRIGMAFAFASIGSLIIIVFSQYRPLLLAVYDLLGRLGLMLSLLLTALLLRSSEKLQPYWHLFFGLFIMACAVSLDWWTARFVLDTLGGLPQHTSWGGAGKTQNRACCGSHHHHAHPLFWQQAELNLYSTW